MKTQPGIRGSLRRVLLASACFALLAAPAAAESTGSLGAAGNLAHGKSSATELNEQGLALYSAQDFRHALEKFIGAYALDSDPNLLFNIGRCYEQLGESDAALEKYQQFVADPGAEASGVRRARASIDAILEQIEARPAARGGPHPAASPPVPPSSVADSTSRADWRPWLTLGGSIAFAAAGATSYALGARDHAQVTNLPEYGNSAVPAPMTWQRADALVQSGNTKKIAGGVLLGLSGALAAATVALFLSEHGEGPAEPALPVQPVTLHGGGGLVLAGNFR